ncbi:MAG TPA: hypothetical protein DCO72_08490 [Ruminococcus sp.]|nr:hypothetical protein [Ruminococcus sp.]
MDFNFEYLQELLQEVNNLYKTFKYFDVDENDCEITYIANKNYTRIGTQQGLWKQYDCQRYHFKEKIRIRKGSKYYCKIYRKKGKIIRVDSYVAGRVDVVFLAYYSGNKRFLFPFSLDGSFYPVYSYVTHFNGNEIDEEYFADSVQIVYEHYQRLDKNHYEYDCINYVPKGTYPILSVASGIFTLKPELQYTSKKLCTYSSLP